MRDSIREGTRGEMKVSTVPPVAGVPTIVVSGPVARLRDLSTALGLSTAKGVDGGRETGDVCCVRTSSRLGTRVTYSGEEKQVCLEIP